MAYLSAYQRHHSRLLVLATELLMKISLARKLNSELVHIY